MNKPMIEDQDGMAPFAIDDALAAHPDAPDLRTSPKAPMGDHNLYASLSEGRLGLNASISHHGRDGHFASGAFTLDGTPDQMIALGHMLMQAGAAAKALDMIEHNQKVES